MRPARALLPALLAASLAGGAHGQAGPDDGPDITLSGHDGVDWLTVCEGETIEGEPIEGRIGGPRRADSEEMTFRAVGHLVCEIQAGPGEALTLRLDKEGGRPFCPLTGARGPGPCQTQFAAMESASFEFEAVP